MNDERATNKAVNSEMLILARESREVTQKQLANMLGVSQGEISRYEGGLRTVGPDELERIADVLGYPASFFYQPGQRYGLGSSGLHHRKRKTLPSRTLDALIAKLNVLRLIVGRLLKGVDIEATQKFPQIKVERYRGNVEHIAEVVRATWKIPSGPVKDLVGVIENAGGVVHPVDMGTRKLDALVQWVPPTPPIFLVNQDIPGDRLRFTLAHEIAHLVMHDEPHEYMEEEADRFASEFLMPARNIRPDLDRATLPHLAQLKPYWRVSIAALIRRARDLEAITDRQYRSLYEEMSRPGYRIEEPVPIPLERPTLLKEIFDAHSEELGYSMAELAALLNLYEEELTTEYVPQSRVLRLVSSRRTDWNNAV